MRGDGTEWANATRPGLDEEQLKVVNWPARVCYQGPRVDPIRSGLNTPLVASRPSLSGTSPPLSVGLKEIEESPATYATVRIAVTNRAV